MFSQEDLTKQIKLITQNAWRQEANTTINAVCEYIVRESLEIFTETLIEHEARIEALEALLRAPTKPQKDTTRNGKNGGLSQPQRSS